MAFLIGVDEAGYGPNLGPLVISATVWQVPEEARREDLYDRLADVVSREPVDVSSTRRVAFGDSKQLYHPGGGLDALELGVLSALTITNNLARRWSQLWTALDSTCVELLNTTPWYQDYDEPLPCSVDPEVVGTVAVNLQRGCERAGVECLGIRSRVLFPATFNRLVDEHGNKAEALSTSTLELLKQILPSCSGEPLLIQCDKHGGRNKYGPLLQRAFPDYLVRVIREDRELSVYRWAAPQQTVEVRFAKGGESFLPTALASMMSKYLRELAMRAFNRFWQRHVPDLKPTAGYPLDARRFKQDITQAQQRLGIGDDILWRKR